MEFMIYHNPRCSKSRATLQLLEDNGINPQVFHYLETPPDHQQLDSILRGLDKEPRELLRKNGPEYPELGIDNPSLGRDHLIEIMITNPCLIERPIVLAGDRIVIGRPPESVLELLN
jgi:arsenate reductase